MRDTGYSEEWYADRLSKMKQNPLNSAVDVPSRPEAGTDNLEPAPSKKKDRFAEKAGELGQKIHAQKEQINGRIRLWLPYPPSTNLRMTMFKGRMIKSAEARSYRKIAQEALVGMKPLTGDLDVSMQINRPQRRGDIDNVLKNVFDALTGIAFVDDDQIAMLNAIRYDGEHARENPGIHICIKQIV